MPGTRVRPSAGPSINLVPGIHVFSSAGIKDVDGRDKPGHDVRKRATTKTPLAPSRCVPRAPGRVHSAEMSMRAARPAPGRIPARSAFPTVMRRRCGWWPRSAGLLTRAKAMSAAASFFSSAVASSAPNTAATLPSVSLRRFTRSTLVANAGSAASAASPKTFVRQDAPFAVALNGNQNVDAVAAAERPVGRDRGVGEADAPRRRARLLLHQRHRHPVRHGVEHADRKLGAFA